MTQGETTIVNGGGSQTHRASRWGDYSMMAVDPTDDCTFWYTTEYLQNTGSAPWRTRIASVQLRDCGAPVDDPPTVALTSPADGATVYGTIAVTANASGGTGITQVGFFVDGASIGADTNGSDGWSVDWDTTTSGNGSHAVSATATDGTDSASDNHSVTVSNPVSQGTMHVGALSGTSANFNKNFWRAEATITVSDRRRSSLLAGRRGGNCVSQRSESSNAREGAENRIGARSLLRTPICVQITERPPSSGYSLA